MEIIIDGIRYVPEKRKSSTQGLTDRELINRAEVEYYENRDPREIEEAYNEKMRVW